MKLNKKELDIKNKLINFEILIKTLYEEGRIKAPIHLSGNNEDQLIQIFRKIKLTDWVVSNWRSHYHALLHGIPEDWLKKRILEGRSMGINSKKYKFYSSSIVGGGLPIALGLAMSIKKKKLKEKVFVFIGDMTFETGIFHETYKYSKNFNLPIKYIIEDNGLSTNTPTKLTWNKTQEPSRDIIYYKYKRKFPHHGTGNWVLF